MTEITNLVEQVKRSTDYQINKRLLREKAIADMHLPFEGGMFKITPELLGFVASWPVDWIILEDIYQNPIEVDRVVFLAQASQLYSKTMGNWRREHEKIKRFRKV